MKIITFYALTLIAINAAGADPIRDYDDIPAERPLKDIEFADGLFGFSGRFRTIFDNTDYSSVRLAKPDECTFFQSDLIVFFDIRPSDNLNVRIGPKVIYEFGNEDGSGSTLRDTLGEGPVARFRIRADYDNGNHNLSFGHIRDTQTPLTFEMESVDDDLAAIRWRYEGEKLNSRIFLSRLSLAAASQYETFLGAVRLGFNPWGGTAGCYNLNLATIHQGGFDTGDSGAYPPVGERKKEVLIVGGEIRQPLFVGLYVNGEGAYSVSRSDVNITVKDGAFWGETGWANNWLDVSGRFYRVGRYFSTPFGVDLLRNDENIGALSDFYAASCNASAYVAFSDYARLYITFEQGWKWLYDDFEEMDFDYNIEKVRFDLDL